MIKKMLLSNTSTSSTSI